ncbi:hypothetical protein V6N12_042259 [Hibiscus sabdariffa]|uniref:Uncharacterized protein n=1 Tax=Hibiscus sabdariffa TaxID=183260 RepID=A0ABR2EHY2_9ROSI
MDGIVPICALHGAVCAESGDEIDKVIVPLAVGLSGSRYQPLSHKKGEGVEVIEHNVDSMRVFKILNIMLSFLSPKERLIATQRLIKENRGRPHKSQQVVQVFVNASLYASDLENRKTIILREARETL